MIDNNKMRDVFMAYFYCLIHSPYQTKFTITQLDAFNKIEKKIYDVYYKKFINEEPIIDRITLTYDMQLENILDSFNLILFNGDKNKWDYVYIDQYYNSIMKEYRLDLFREAKSDKDINEAITKLDHLNETTSMITYDVKYGLDQILESKNLKSLETGLSLFDDDIFFSNGLVGIMGKSGCFSKEQLIHTKRGLIKISEITLNDYVLSYNHKLKINEYRKVLEVFNYKTHTDKLYKIKLKDGTIIKVTENHEFFINNSYVKIKDVLFSLKK